jgi:hypothetical protein
MSDSVPALSAVSTASTFTRPSVKEVLESLVTKVGEKGCDPFPILDRVWDIYSGKGIRTVFLTVGTSKAALADLEIAESLGCPLNIVALSEAERASWTEVLGILKERKREPTASAFSEGAESKWILPKNVRLQEAIPWWENGTIDISGNVLKTQNVGSLMTSIAAAMKLKDNANRIDILKIDTEASAPGLEKAILGAVLSAGYRPAIVLVRWNKMPDVDLSTTLAAGHLQNSGYSLVGKVDNKFVYYFTDEDLYQICSWEGITATNPVMTEIIEATKTPRFHSSAKTEVV